MGIDEGANTRIKSLVGETEDFRVGVGVHQGSALFSLVIDEITKSIQGYSVGWRETGGGELMSGRMKGRIRE